MNGVSRAGAIRSSGSRAGAQPPDLVLHAQRAHELERVAQRRDVAGRERAAPPGGVEPGGGRRRRDAGRQAAPAGQRLDREQARALDVQRAAAARRPCSSTKSRRKPVGGRSTSAATAIRRSVSSRPGASANARASRSATSGAPHTGALSITTESSIRPRSWSGSSQPAADRPPPTGRPSARTARSTAVAPVGVRVQPARRQPVEHARGERLHRGAQLRLVVALPGERAVDVGAGERLAPAEAAGREPRERRRRRAELGDRELDQPPRPRCRGRRRCMRLIAGAATPGVVQRDDRRRELARRPRPRRATSRGARDQRAQPERGAVLGGQQVDVVEHADQPPARVEHRQVADAVVEHLQQRVRAGAVGGRSCGPARSSRPRAACRSGRPRRARACAGRGR